LRDTLSSLETSARAELDMRQRVEAGRTTLRRGAAIIAGVTAAFAFGLMVFNAQYLRPYGSVNGQLMLSVVCGIFSVGFAWLGKLSRRPPQGRIFAPPAGAR
jgi:Flp pilus assembly protein TadB